MTLKVKIKGFTLLETMVVVALVAILTTLAYGGYENAVRKSNRGDAQAALTALAGAMQRYYTEQISGTYVGAAASGPPGPPANGLFPSQAPIDGDNKLYNLRIVSATATAYSLSAIPISGTSQAADKCGTLTLTSTGQRGISGGGEGVTWQDCWK